MRSATRGLEVLGAAVCASLAGLRPDARAAETTEQKPFVVFDASTATELPRAVADGGSSPAIKTLWGSAEDRRAAVLQAQFVPGLTFAALVVDAASSPKAFADPEFPPGPEALLVTCRAAKGCATVVQVADSTGDVFEAERDAAGGWSESRFDLSPEMNGWKRLSRADGRFDSRLRSISVGLRTRAAAEGRLELARVALVPSALAIELKTDAPGNIFVLGDRVAGTISARAVAAGVVSRIRFEDAYGKLVKELAGVALGNGPVELALPDEFGFYYVRATAPGYRPGPPRCYTVIPDNRVEGKEPNSPFGVNCHWGDYWYKPIAAELAKRAGIGWIRDGHHQDSTAPGGAYTESKRVGLCQMSITVYCPSREQDVLTPDGKYDFKDFLGRQGAYAKAVADHVDWYDMTNEPVFAWSKVFGNSGTPRRWVDIFCRHFVPQYYEAMQKADPGARLLMEGYWNTDDVETLIKCGSAKYVAAFSPHFYAHKDDPEDHWSLRGGYRRYVELMREHNLKLPVWIGEIGFTTFIGTSQHFKSVTELEQAALLVRALSMHFAAGVERIFYYDLVEWTAATWGGDPSGDPYNCEFHFGLLRKDHTPKPAFTAYANLIAQTKGARWLGRASVGGENVHIYAFARAGEPAGFVAWCRKGTASVPLGSGARVTDIFGKTGTWSGGDLLLSEVPVYIHGCNPEAFGIVPIPTYALMPRSCDPTDVKLGARYGSRPRGASEGRSRPPAPAPGPAPARRPPPRELSASMDKLLLARLRDALASGVAVRFFASSMRHNARVTAVLDESALRMVVGPAGAAVETVKQLDELSAEDKKSLALALLREGEPADHCLAGFYLLAAGDAEGGELQLLRAAPEEAQKLRDAFAH